MQIIERRFAEFNQQVCLFFTYFPLFVSRRIERNEQSGAPRFGEIRLGFASLTFFAPHPEFRCTTLAAFNDAFSDLFWK